MLPLSKLVQVLTTGQFQDLVGHDSADSSTVCYGEEKLLENSKWVIASNKGKISNIWSSSWDFAPLPSLEQPSAELSLDRFMYWVTQDCVSSKQGTHFWYTSHLYKSSGTRKCTANIIFLLQVTAVLWKAPGVHVLPVGQLQQAAAGFSMSQWRNHLQPQGVHVHHPTATCWGWLCSRHISQKVLYSKKISRVVRAQCSPVLVDM